MYNNNQFGFNPYYQPMMSTNGQQFNGQQTTTQNATQLATQRQFLNGKLVDSVEVAKTIEYPLDGSISYFPLTDGSMIVTKQLLTNGTSKTTIYKPIEEKDKPEIKYATMDDLKKSLKEIDLSEIDDLKDEIKELKSEIKKIKKDNKDE